MSQALATSLFEKLGGTRAIEAAVTEFHQRVLADADLKGFFAGVDMNEQDKKQVQFITMALGGPNEYDGRTMRDAHDTLGISGHHFNLFAGHLADALKGAGVDEAEVREVVEAIGPLKEHIVTA